MAEVTTPPSGEVTVAGRTFRLGVVYTSRSSRYFRKPRRLLNFDPDSPLPGGRVTVEIVPANIPQVMSGTEWTAWAGEEAEGGPAEAGRG